MHKLDKEATFQTIIWKTNQPNNNFRQKLQIKMEWMGNFFVNGEENVPLKILKCHYCLFSSSILPKKWRCGTISWLTIYSKRQRTKISSIQSFFPHINACYVSKHNPNAVYLSSYPFTSACSVSCFSLWSSLSIHIPSYVYYIYYMYFLPFWVFAFSSFGLILLQFWLLLLLWDIYCVKQDL